MASDNPVELINFLVVFPFPPPLFLHPVIFAVYLNTNLVNGLTCLATCTTKSGVSDAATRIPQRWINKVAPLVWKTYLKFYKAYWNQQQQHKKFWRYSYLKRAQIGKDCRERSMFTDANICQNVFCGWLKSVYSIPFLFCVFFNKTF